MIDYEFSEYIDCGELGDKNATISGKLKSDGESYWCDPKSIKVLITAWTDGGIDVSNLLNTKAQQRFATRLEEHFEETYQERKDAERWDSCKD